MDFFECGTVVLVAISLPLSVVFFVSGFRFINPLDTAVHFVPGGIVAVASARYLWHRWCGWHRWRRARAIR